MGELQAYVLEGGVETIAGYNFNWYNASDLTTIIGTGATIGNLAGGQEYVVIATHIEAGCFSSQASELVGTTKATITVAVEKLRDNNSCLNPNGSMQVKVFLNGVEDDPAKYDISWRLTDDFTQIVATGPVITDLIGGSGGSRVVYVKSLTTGCDATSGPNNVDDFTTSIALDPVEIVHATCGNGEVGSIEVIASGATNINYFWYNGTTVSTATEITSLRDNAKATALAPGMYTVVAQDADTDCSSIELVQVIENHVADPIISATITDDIACDPGKAKGEITVSASTSHPYFGEPAGGYKYEWYAGSGTSTSVIDTDATLENRPAGNYTVRVTNNDLSCETIRYYTIGSAQEDFKIDGISKSRNTVCDPTEAAGGAYDGSLTITRLLRISDNTVIDLSGTEADKYTFKWYAGNTASGSEISNTKSAENLAAGQYTVEITNNDTGCEFTRTINLGENLQNPEIILTATKQTSCDPDAPNAKITPTLGGGQPLDNNYEVTWYAGNTTTTALPATGDPSQAIQVGVEAQQLSGGQTYTVRILNKNTGCSAIASYAIETEITYPQVSIAVTDITDCRPGNGGVLTATVNGDANNYTFKWYYGEDTNGTVVAEATGQNVLDSWNGENLPTGDYTLVVTNNDTQCEALANTKTIRRPVQAFVVEGEEVAKAAGSCGSGSSGQLRAYVSSGTYNFTWYRGAPADLSLDFYTNPKVDVASLTQVSTENGVSESFFNTDDAGAYTVVAENATTGCKEYTVVYLGSVAAPEIIGVNTTPSNSCITANGSAEVELNLTGTNTYASYNYYLFQNNANPTKDNIGTEIAMINGSSDAVIAGGGTPIFPNLEAGNYSILVTIDNGSGILCTNTRAFTIEQTAFAPSIEEVIITNNSNCGGSPANGSIYVEVTARDANPTTYTYKLIDLNGVYPDQEVNGAGTSYTFPTLASSTYKIEVTAEATGCMVSSQNPHAIVDNVPAKPTVEVTPATSTFCEPQHNGKITVTAISGVSANLADYSYIFYLKADYEAGSATPLTQNGSDAAYEISGLAPDNYVVVAELITDLGAGGLGCESVPVYTTVNYERSYPEINLTATHNTSCGDATTYDGTVTATVAMLAPATEPAAGYQYQWQQWNEASGTYIDLTGETSVALGNLAKGKYRIVVTNLDTQCSAEAEAEVYNQPTVPVIADAAVQTEPQLLCNADGSVSITAISPGNLAEYEFTWYYEGDFTQPLRDASNAIITTSTLSPANYPGFKAGEYQIVATRLATATGGASCASAYATAEVDYMPPTIEIILESSSNQTACSGTPNGLLEILVQSNPSDPTDAYTYAWYAGNTATGTVIDSDALAENLAAGKYTVAVTNTRTGCIVTATYNIIEDQYVPQVSASVQNVSVCTDNVDLPVASNGIILPKLANFDENRPMKFQLFKVADETEMNSYAYPADGTANANFMGESFYVAADKSYEPFTGVEEGFYVLFTEEDFSPGLGCERGRFGVEVLTQTTTPVAEIVPVRPVTNCQNTELGIEPNGQLSATVNGKVSGYNFAWYNAQDELIGSSPMVSGLAFGATYTVKVTNRFTGCFSTTDYTFDQEEIETVPAPVLSSIPQTYCIDAAIFPNVLPNGTVSATVNGKSAGYIFHWVDVEGVNSFDISTSTASVQANLMAGVYQVSATDINTGCSSEPTQVVVGFEPSGVEFRVETKPGTCSTKADVPPVAGKAIVVGKGIISTAWYDENGGEMQLGGNTLDAEPGNYYVDVYNSNYCSDRMYFTIPAEITPYNLVSPNGDGENEFFVIDCIEKFPVNTVTVFNRTGTVVFEIENYNATDRVFTGQGNKGIYLNGNKLPDGTYFYIIDKHIPGQKPYSGYLELKR